MVSLQLLVGPQPVGGPLPMGGPLPVGSPLPVGGPQCSAPRFVIPTIPDGRNLSLRNPLVILKGENWKVCLPHPLTAKRHLMHMTLYP